MARCKICHRKLHDPESIAAGCGPTCRQKAALFAGTTDTILAQTKPEPEPVIVLGTDESGKQDVYARRPDGLWTNGRTTLTADRMRSYLLRYMPRKAAIYAPLFKQ